MQPAKQRHRHQDHRLIRANHRRGERLVRLPDGRTFVARPTLHALATVEDERGAISELAMRFEGGPVWVDVVAVLDACTDGGVTPADTLALGLTRAAALAAELVATAFDERAAKQRQKSAESERDEAADGRLPATRMTGTAVALWHVQPAEAWAMTVPEWWDAATVHIEANTPKSGTSWSDLSEEKRAELRKHADELPDEITDEMETAE